jgi:hypothetical protein
VGSGVGLRMGGTTVYFLLKFSFEFLSMFLVVFFLLKGNFLSIEFEI